LGGGFPWRICPAGVFSPFEQGDAYFLSKGAFFRGQRGGPVLGGRPRVSRCYFLRAGGEPREGGAPQGGGGGGGGRWFLLAGRGGSGPRWWPPPAGSGGGAPPPPDLHRGQPGGGGARRGGAGPVGTRPPAFKNPPAAPPQKKGGGSGLWAGRLGARLEGWISWNLGSGFKPRLNFFHSWGHTEGFRPLFGPSVGRPPRGPPWWGGALGAASRKPRGFFFPAVFLPQADTRCFFWGGREWFCVRPGTPGRKPSFFNRGTFGGPAIALFCRGGAT